MRFYIALLTAKLVNKLIRVSRKSAGYTWPGHIALSIYSGVLKLLEKKFPGGIVLVSGTNGKTTTAKLISHILESAGFLVTNNKTGANLKNGLVSAFLVDYELFDGRAGKVCVFEVDEMALPEVLKYVTPRMLLLLNLSRDQLDRYGEVDMILEKWLRVVEDLDNSVSLVLDSEQVKFHSLANVFKGRVFYFDSDHTYLSHTGLYGDFNAKNVNAAVLVSVLFGVSEETALQSLSKFEAAYGRGELLEHSNSLFRVFLAKNPASFNTNLDTICGDGIEYNSLLFILNDEIRDGRDVSWIYDVRPEKIREACNGKDVFISGTRCLDMAVRLKYAGIDVSDINIHPGLKVLLERISGFQSTKEFIALPNYSAMLELRKVIVGREIL